MGPVGNAYERPSERGRAMAPNKKPPLRAAFTKCLSRFFYAAAGFLLLVLILVAVFLRFKYAKRRFFFMTLLYCLPIRIFTSVPYSDFVVSLW